MQEQQQTPTTASQTDEPALVRPALIVGLGGTGHRIALRVKAAFTQALGEVPTDRVRILAFDTADEEAAVVLDGRTLTLEPDRELFNIGRTPVANILRNLDRQPAIAARLPSLHALPPVMLRAGAKQVRPLGLLALLWRYQEVERRLQTAIWELAGKETLSREMGQVQGINVFLCFSVVGGTGSGTFLDVAYLVRDLFRELGTLSDLCYVTGVAVLPQAFRGIKGPNLTQNTVAALKELGHCMMRGGFSFQYPNGRYIETAQPPFNLLYLLDGVDEQGYVWRGLNELCDVAAMGIYLQVGSQVGRKGENDFDNLDDVLGGQTEDGEGTFCGSFGLAWLRFDAPRVAEWCAARLALKMVDEGLLGSAASQQDEAEQLAETWMRAHALNAESLWEILAHDEQNVPLTVDLRPPDWIRTGRDARLPQEAVRHVRDYERVRLRGEYAARCRVNGQGLSERLIQSLEARVSTVLSNDAHGVRASLALCRALDERLARLENTLQAAHATHYADRARQEEELAAREETLLRSASAHLLLRGRSISVARDRYLQAALAYLEQLWQETLSQESTTLLAALRDAVAARTRALNALQAGLRAAARSLADRVDTLLGAPDQDRWAATIDLAEPNYCRQLYDEHSPPLEDELALLSKAESLDTWYQLDVESVMERLLEVARRPFSPVAETSVEQVLYERADEASPAARKAQLFRLAAPSWNLDLTRLRDGGAGLRSVQVLGVPDEDDSLFQEEARALVSTHDPTSIAAFEATVGAPFAAIQQYPDYLRRYQDAHRRRPLHVLPQFQTDGAQCKLVFALSTIFGLIYAKGTHFYYRPGDPLDPPLKLDQGLDNAIRCFAQADSLSVEAQERIERQIEEMGTAAAVERMAVYYAPSSDGERGSADTTLIEMRKLVRGYADELRTTLRAAGSG